MGSAAVLFYSMVSVIMCLCMPDSITMTVSVYVVYMLEREYSEGGYYVDIIIE